MTIRKHRLVCVWRPSFRAGLHLFWLIVLHHHRWHTLWVSVNEDRPLCYAPLWQVAHLRPRPYGMPQSCIQHPLDYLWRHRTGHCPPHCWRRVLRHHHWHSFWHATLQTGQACHPSFRTDAEEQRIAKIKTDFHSTASAKSRGHKLIRRRHFYD